MKKSVKPNPAKNVDEYLDSLPEMVRATLGKLRKTIKAIAPKAEELISYRIPCYKLNGMLVGFAAFPNHCSFIIMSPRLMGSFKDELKEYDYSGATIRFPHNKPLPVALVKKLVMARIKENEERLVTKNSVPAKTGKSKKPSDEERVNAYMSKLKPPLKDEIEAVRKIIKNANPKLNERIKWNAPSYYYIQDILTFGPYKQGKILLVFHHPAVVKIKSKLLEGDYNNRRLVYFKNKSEAEEHKKELSGIINEIVKMIDNK